MHGPDFWQVRFTQSLSDFFFTMLALKKPIFFSQKYVLRTVQETENKRDEDLVMKQIYL